MIVGLFGWKFQFILFSVKYIYTEKHHLYHSSVLICRQTGYSDGECHCTEFSITPAVCSGNKTGASDACVNVTGHHNTDDAAASEAGTTIACHHCTDDGQTGPDSRPADFTSTATGIYIQNLSIFRWLFKITFVVFNCWEEGSIAWVKSLFWWINCCIAYPWRNTLAFNFLYGFSCQSWVL